VSRRTLAEEVYRKLKELIVTSEFLPGTPLQEIALSERLQVSRTPVREALRILESEGLVEIQPHRGARVAQVSRQDVMDAYEIREWIEPAAAAKAAQLINEATLAELQVACERMPVDPRTHEQAGIALQADREFHNLIVQVADNHLAQALLKETQAITRRAAYFVPPGRYTKSKEEHKAILQALRNHDAEAAAEHMRTHIINARNRMIGGP
jgi:DNA-binding GntR family transcriptional regulator